jgi:hypothetical protein
MSLDSDVNNADSHLHVEFYENTKEPYVGVPFVVIMAPGDKTSIFDQPANEDHKIRFPRQWFHFQSKTNGAQYIGTPLRKWHEDEPSVLNEAQLIELEILRFQTVDQVATASDSQIQRVGMGGLGLRERARAYLNKKANNTASLELAETREELSELKAQIAILMAARKPGRPRKEEADEFDNAPVGDTGH